MVFSVGAFVWSLESFLNNESRSNMFLACLVFRVMSVCTLSSLSKSVIHFHAELPLCSEWVGFAGVIEVYWSLPRLCVGGSVAKSSLLISKVGSVAGFAFAPMAPIPSKNSSSLNLSLCLGTLTCR